MQEEDSSDHEMFNPLMTRKDSFDGFCSKLEEILEIVSYTTPFKDFV